MTQHGYRRRRGVVVSVGNRAAEDCGHAEDAEVITRNDPTLDHFRLSAGVEVQFQRIEGTHIGHNAFLLAQARQRLQRKRGADRESGRAIDLVAAVKSAWSKLLT